MVMGGNSTSFVIYRGSTIRKTHEGTDVTITIVCHAAFGSVTLTAAGRWSVWSCRFNFSHAAIARVDIKDDDTVSRLLLLNYVRHIRRGLVTEGLEFSPAIQIRDLQNAKTACIISIN
jgi:hypothetical protein